MSAPRSPRIEVVVTQEIIDAAEQRDSSHCMIAEAIKVACPWARNVSVDLQTIRMSDPSKGRRYTYLTPRVGQIALLDFDAGEHTEPLRFELRGAQITKAGMRKTQAKPATAQQRESMLRARAARDQIPNRQQMVDRDATEGEFEKVGGKTPPVGALSSRGAGVPTGRRRAYGLRAMDR